MFTMKGYLRLSRVIMLFFYSTNVYRVITGVTITQASSNGEYL